MVLVRYRSNRVFSLGEWTPHFPAGLACPAVLFNLSRRSPTGLSPLSSGFPPGSAQRFVEGAAPLSLATTRGIVSFPRAT
jgi:hypothetical protein